MRTIGVVTVGRSDWGIFLPVVRRIRDDPSLRLRVYASGMHLAPEHGLTARAIEEDGFAIDARVESLISSDTPSGIGKSMGLGVIGFAELFARERPDILLVLGDRFEMHAAALAALPFKIPVAHIHGGEVTEGAIDEALRHSISKMAHVHFVATERYAARLHQMGEEAWRVTVSGAPGLDTIRELPAWTRAQTEKELGVPLSPAPLVVTYHPTTLEFERTEEDVEAFLSALDQAGHPVVFTLPNADTRNSVIRNGIQRYVGSHPNAYALGNLGSLRFFNLLRHASAMVGNSSAGIIEAASFRLPVVNVGTRQAGRIRPSNVVDVGSTPHEILKGIRRATDPVFRQGLADLRNPYGDGHAAGRIVARLKEVELGEGLLRKRFADGEGSTS